MTVGAVIHSMRLRTLPLSLAGVTLGLLLAVADYRVGVWTAVSLLLVTVSLQILSNLCNELGDALHGTDGSERQGPRYALASGEMSVREMKGLIAVQVVVCIASGLWMLKASFGELFCLESICLMMLGAAAIGAAMRYTLGHNPYGYRGLGDLYVFIFFGLVSVLGAWFVCTHALPTWQMALPAAAIGFFSVGVLNVNNIRDMKTDAATRVTVAMRLGLRRARIYQTLLIVLGWAALAAFCLLRVPDLRHWLFVLVFPAYGLHLRMVWTREDRSLDPALPLLVLSTFVLALLMGLGFNLYQL